MSGPLTGVRVIELAAIGPAPFCGMVLSDQGADVIRVDRPGAPELWTHRVAGRGRRSIVIDLKQAEGVELLLKLVESADALIEGLRPGVTERLGVGPAVCLARNPRLVYVRITGWGQEGPLAAVAGHDINYIALTGALHAIGTLDRPSVPLNLLADYGGGGMLAAFGLVAALLEARSTGRGQVVDCAMVDGAALLMTAIYELFGLGLWEDRRLANLLDGGAPFYSTYQTADGESVAVGALESEFYARLVEGLGLERAKLPDQLDRSGWARLREVLEEALGRGTRAQWLQRLSGSDACVAPVLSLAEAPADPHNQARSTFVEWEGVTVPGPAPRFSAHQRRVPSPAPRRGEHTDQVLRELGIPERVVSMLRSSGTIAGPEEPV
jgi:alpha-methylacyl-CoA racemase